MGGGGGGALSSVACLSRLTVDRESVSRRSTPFLLLLEIPPALRRSVRLFPYVASNTLVILSSSSLGEGGWGVNKQVFDGVMHRRDTPDKR